MMAESSADTTSSSSPSPRQILSAQYLEKHSGRKDLIRRLRTVSKILHEDSNVEPDAIEYPGLAAMASSLVDDYLGHKDKEVRLYAVLCCMELFAIYAPEAPWNDTEVCYIFQQTIRQMANFAHTTNPRQPHYSNYLRILQLLAEVNIGVVLVDLAKDFGENVLDDADGGENEVSPAQSESDSPLELLCELFRTLLQSLRVQHPNEVMEFTQKVISGCLGEYQIGSGISVPLPLVEEILMCIGQPKVYTTNPAALQPPAESTTGSGRKRKGTLAVPMQMEHTNPAFVVAAQIVRKHNASLSTPVSNLLNGLINGEPHIVQRSSIIADEEDCDGIGEQQQAGVVSVWDIVYELGKHADSYLTTVIGTVSAKLLSEETSKRHQTVKLLGKLFYFKSSKLAKKFGPCFKNWLKRCTDKEKKIRLTMVTSLCSILQEAPCPEVVSDTHRALTIMLSDPDDNVRMAVVREVSDFAFMNMKEKPVPKEIMDAMGLRVMSKNAEERIAALTAISQIYYKYYMFDALQGIQSAGEDYDVEMLSQLLTEKCSRTDVFFKKGKVDSLTKDLYEWIPTTVFESMTVRTSLPRALLIIDTLLLGSSISKKKDKNLTPAARAVGLAVIMDSLRMPGQSAWEETGGTRAFQLMVMFLRTRAAVQNGLSSYIDARSKSRDYPQGSEEALAADIKAKKQLQRLLTFIPPAKASAAASILDKLHSARDKQIFRLLASISDPKHGNATRKRALEELPKKTKSLGDPVKDWVTILVNRCIMGDFINFDVVQSCISLAKKCFDEKKIPSCVALLSCAKIAVGAFPSLCEDEGSFQYIQEMFSACHDFAKTPRKGEVKEQIEQSGLATALSSMMSAATRRKQMIDQTAPQEKLASNNEKRLCKELLQVCTKDGTPRQARDAVESLVTMYTRDQGGTRTTSNEKISALLKDLTSPSKMVFDSGSPKSGGRLVSILSALSALASLAPHSFSNTGRGESAVKFAMETILLGRLARSQTGGSDLDSDFDAEVEDHKTPAKKTKRSTSVSKLQHRSPAEEKYLLENNELSLATRVICAAIEFLVSYIRSTIFASKKPVLSSQSSEESIADGNHIALPSTNRIKALFGVLVQIIRDQGIPPSNRDRRECRARQDRAAIRQCAAIQLLRLCDNRLEIKGQKIEKNFLTFEMWHTLGSIFLDEERVVRQAVIDEIVDFITGEGVYKSPEGGHKSAPPLRFVAFVVFCADGDGRWNGNAAKVGSTSLHAKTAAQKCIVNLRSTYDRALSQCRVVDGRGTEEVQEEVITRMLMPEYIVPYAFHLLCFRRETSVTELENDEQRKSIGRKQRTSEDSSKAASDEARRKIMLKKRIRWLFEPLVHSLGDGADNISFLLSMTQSLAGSSPVDTSADEVSIISSVGSLGLSIESRENREEAEDSMASHDAKNNDIYLPEVRLQSICSVARQILLSFVKKDVNLSEYPGSVRIPSALFALKSKEVGRRTSDPIMNESSPLGKENDGMVRVKRSRSGQSKRPSNVQFSTEEDGNAGSPLQSPMFSPGVSILSSPGLSPVVKSSSTPKAEAKQEQAPNTSESEAKTLTPGETPVSTFSSKKGKGLDVSSKKQQKKKLFQSPDAPILSASTNETIPDEESNRSSDDDSDQPFTQESAEVVRPNKKKTLAALPAPIKVGRSPSSKPRGDKRRKSSFDFEEDEDEVFYKKKPLGNSNRAGGKKNVKRSVVKASSPPPRAGSRRGLRSRS